MLRATAGIEASRPTLLLVPRRRRATHVAVVISVLVGLAMLGAAAFQTQLAQRQLMLDQLDDRIQQSHARYESLRLERSQLRSPERLAGIAAANGMQASTDTDFRAVSPEVEMAVQQSTGMITQRDIPYGEALLDEYRVVKGLGEDIP
jgi:cell division protein FtsL